VAAHRLAFWRVNMLLVIGGQGGNQLASQLAEGCHRCVCVCVCVCAWRACRIRHRSAFLRGHAHAAVVLPMRKTRVCALLPWLSAPFPQNTGERSPVASLG
jgi:hypothetical protein